MIRADAVLSTRHHGLMMGQYAYVGVRKTPLKKRLYLDTDPRLWIAQVTAPHGIAKLSDDGGKIIVSYRGKRTKLSPVSRKHKYNQCLRLNTCIFPRAYGIFHRGMIQSAHVVCEAVCFGYVDYSMTRVVRRISDTSGSPHGFTSIHCSQRGINAPQALFVSLSILPMGSQTHISWQQQLANTASRRFQSVGTDRYCEG